MTHGTQGKRSDQPESLPADQLRTADDGGCRFPSAEEQFADLTHAIRSNRTIGVAVGILVERYSISPDAAFAYLRRVSQNSNQKLRDLASELVQTGTLLGQETARPDSTDHA